jgi:hypothetical protein
MSDGLPKVDPVRAGETSRAIGRTLQMTAASRWARAEGLPFPLGATWIEEQRAYNFALYSKHAQSVTLLLYSESDIVNPAFAYRFDYLKNKSGRIWHCRIPVESMKGASYYAYSVDGPLPNGRFEWHWFDREKILLDGRASPSSRSGRRRQAVAQDVPGGLCCCRPFCSLARRGRNSSPGLPAVRELASIGCAECSRFTMTRIW